MAYTRKKRRQSKKKMRGGNQADKCVFIDLESNIQGLGNQLFSYAAALVVKQKTGHPICVITKSGNPHRKEGYTHLMDAKVIDTKDMNSRIQSAKPILHHVADYFGEWDDTNIHYNSTKNTGNLRMKSTLYQNYKAVHKAVPGVKEMLLKNEFHKDHYNQFRTSFDSPSSAFMHVRRGDYSKFGWELSVNYYCKGLAELEKNSQIKTIYVFSNDLEWCKTHEADWKKHTTKNIEYKDNLNEFETLYCMSLCEAGAVISNSTFSCWGAMMGADMKHSNYIVYPTPWGCNWGTHKNPLSLPERWKGLDKV